MPDELKQHPGSARFQRAMKRLLEHDKTGPWSGNCYRFTSAKYAKPSDFLSGQGSKIHGSRWIAANITPAIYVATTVELALAESVEQKRRFNLPDWEAMPLIVRGVQIEVSKLVDLTNGDTRRSLRVSKKRILAPGWRHDNRELGKESLAQAIGRAAFEAGIEALLVPAATSFGTNIVVFPAILGSKSVIRPLP